MPTYAQIANDPDHYYWIGECEVTLEFDAKPAQTAITNVYRDIQGQAWIQMTGEPPWRIPDSAIGKLTSPVEQASMRAPRAQTSLNRANVESLLEEAMNVLQDLDQRAMPDSAQRQALKLCIESVLIDLGYAHADLPKLWSGEIQLTSS